MYPEVEPYETGMLKVGDGCSIYWEACGNPRGKPAVVLHGGPGSGCSNGMRRLFDPDAYRIILFDQRQCGRSLPSAADYVTDLSVNTTMYLLADMEVLRVHLGVERWLLWGGSWGCTLGLAYAERWPERVSEIVLTGVSTTRRSEIDWLYSGVSPLFPKQWFRFREQAGLPLPDEDLVNAYARLLADSDAAVRERAAAEWCRWECGLLSIRPDFKPGLRWEELSFQMTFARIVTHYFRHGAWLEEGQLLRDAHLLNGIPGVLVQGRIDLDAPLTTAWELAQRWPDAQLVIIEGAGHAGSDPGMTEAVIAATDRFRRN